MAKGKYRVNWWGYRQILNGEPQIVTACENLGQQMAASASRQSGLIYTVDTMPGLNRIHTRVSTQGRAGQTRAGGEMYGRERAFNALAVALGQFGGNVRGGGGGTYRTLTSRLDASRKAASRTKNPKQTGWRAPNYRTTSFKR